MKAFIFLRTIAIFHTVKTSQIGTCFRRCNYIICRDRIFHQIQIKLFDNRTLFFQYFYCMQNIFLYFCIQSVSKITSWNSNLHPFDIIHQCTGKIIFFSCNGGAVFRVVRCNRLQNGRTVCNILCDRPDLIQRRAISDQSITGYRSVCRLDSYHSTEGTWLTNRSSSIRPQCIRTFLCCNCSAGSAGRSPRNMLQIPGILGCSKIGSLRGTSHGKFIHVCFPDNHRSCFFQIQNSLCRKCRSEIS